MIHCTLIRGTSEVRIAGDTIEIGRSTACQVHLPDHRVGLLHAAIRRADDGALRIDAEQEAAVSIDGVLASSAVLGTGTRIEIGPYLLEVGAPAPGDDVTLSLAMLPQHESNGIAAAMPPAMLTGLGIGKRRLGLGLAAFVLLALFLLPLLSRISPAVEKWQARLPVSLTGLLNPAPLSPGHRGFGMQCTACHQELFKPVADAACTACHKGVWRHLAADAAHGGESSLVRCADCHAGHEGKAMVMGYGLTQCVPCHRTLALPIAQVRDFGASHPAFRLSVAQGKDIRRAPDDAAPPERSGLKFSHKAHLVKDGVSTPLGNTVMSCRDCHRLEDSGLHFAPVEMEKTCQQSRCHKQRFAEPLSGLVPHGSVPEIMSRLRSYYMSRAIDAPAKSAGGCGPAPKGGNAAKRILDCADASARSYAAATLFQQTGKALQCVLCHEAAAVEDAEGGWKVAPVRIHRDWHGKAVFNHARHATVDCTACHDKANSESSADVSMPAIAKCRECHAGPGGDGRKVRTPCEDCHQFHRVADRPA